jgi:hypothetical protein
MLYTLSMFVLQPPEWIDKYEWRRFTELELCGMGLFHRFVGEAMEISFDNLDDFPPPPLPGHAADKSRTWRTDGLAFFHSLDAWSKAYETRVMLPNEPSHSITMKTLHLLTSTLPSSLGKIVYQTAISMMDTRMREACLLHSPPPSYRRNIDRFLAVRAFVIRHFCYPRRALWGWWVPEEERGMSTETPDPVTGRRYFATYEALPHYVKPTFFNRWISPAAWASWSLGVPVPGDPEMEGKGWLMTETGPKAFVGKGKAEFAVTKKKLEGNVRVQEPVSDVPRGCPMFVKV